MSTDPSASDLERLKTRIEALRARTVANGCTESEALEAARKVAELLDRHNLSLSDVQISATECERRVVGTSRKTKAPLDYSIAAIADFCDCKVWRETNEDGERRYVFFGLHHDADAAGHLAEMVATAIASELVAYRFTREYQAVPRREKATASSSFGIGMAMSVSRKLRAMKQERDRTTVAAGRDLVVVKSSVVERELEKLNLRFREAQKPARKFVSEEAFNAGTRAGDRLSLNPAIWNP